MSIRALTAVAVAALLAACSGESARPAAGDFKPVPVTPVIGDVVMGSETAPVTVVEYAAFTCSHCRDFWKQDFPRLKANYIDTGKVKYIYRDYPLEAGEGGKAVDGFGTILSSVARCKGKDKFYEMVDALFTAQTDILMAAQKANALPKLLEVVQAHGMTKDEMITCIDHQPELKASILNGKDKATAEKKISSTPTVFVNDEQPPDHRYDGLSAFINTKLGAAAPAPAPAAPAVPAAPPAQ